MLQNKGGKKKENELVFFRKLTLLKSKLNRRFLLHSLLEPLMQSNLDANFLRNNLFIRTDFFSIVKHLLDLTSSNIQLIASVQNNIGLSFASPNITLSGAINWMLDSVSYNKCLISIKVVYLFAILTRNTSSNFFS